MNFPPRTPRGTGRAVLAGLVSICLLAGCNRDETKVYHVDKDGADAAPPAQAGVAEAPPAPAPTNTVPPVAPTPPEAQLHYQAPAGWQEKPLSPMRVASLTAPGPDGQTGDVSVIPLHVAGRDMALINLWRSQVKLPPTSDPNAVRQARPVAIGSEEGRLFQYVSDVPMIGGHREQILVAMLVHGDQTWFFRIVGPDALVNAQRKNFLSFLQSVSFTDNGPEPAAPAAAAGPEAAADTTTATSAPAAPDGGAPATWSVPPGWQPVAPAQFLVAEYLVTGEKDAKANVNVAVLTGDGGGLLANVNRWRGQIGLPDLDEGALESAAQSIAVPGGRAMLVDFTGVDAATGKPARLVGAMVGQERHAWFYKLMGSPSVVARQKGALVAFIQSAHYANDR